MTTAASRKWSAAEEWALGPVGHSRIAYPSGRTSTSCCLACVADVCSSRTLSPKEMRAKHGFPTSSWLCSGTVVATTSGGSLDGRYRILRRRYFRSQTDITSAKTRSQWCGPPTTLFSPTKLPLNTAVVSVIAMERRFRYNGCETAFAEKYPTCRQRPGSFPQATTPLPVAGNLVQA